MYCSKQLLDQRPRSLISQSGKSAAAAVVAAPIRKLCDEYYSKFGKSLPSKERMIEVNSGRVRNSAFWKTNKGLS